MRKYLLILISLLICLPSCTADKNSFNNDDDILSPVGESSTNESGIEQPDISSKEVVYSDSIFEDLPLDPDFSDEEILPSFELILNNESSMSIENITHGKVEYRTGITFSFGTNENDLDEAILLLNHQEEVLTAKSAELYVFDKYGYTYADLFLDESKASALSYLYHPILKEWATIDEMTGIAAFQVNYNEYRKYQESLENDEEWIPSWVPYYPGELDDSLLKFHETEGFIVPTRKIYSCSDWSYIMDGDATLKTQWQEIEPFKIIKVRSIGDLGSGMFTFTDEDANRFFIKYGFNGRDGGMYHALFDSIPDDFFSSDDFPWEQRILLEGYDPYISNFREYLDSENCQYNLRYQDLEREYNIRLVEVQSTSIADKEGSSDYDIAIFVVDNYHWFLGLFGKEKDTKDFLNIKNNWLEDYSKLYLADIDGDQQDEIIVSCSSYLGYHSNYVLKINNGKLDILFNNSKDSMEWGFTLIFDGENAYVKNEITEQNFKIDPTRLSKLQNKYKDSEDLVYTIEMDGMILSMAPKDVNGDGIYELLAAQGKDNTFEVGVGYAVFSYDGEGFTVLDSDFRQFYDDIWINRQDNLEYFEYWYEQQ